jgi:DNA-binding transcriptional LysR family regulator
VSASFRQHIPLYKSSYTVPEFMAVPHIVAGSKLIGIVQKRLAVVSCKSLPLKMFAPPFTLPSIIETLFWHPRHSAEPAHSWFRRLLSQEAADDLSESQRSKAALAAHREEGPAVASRRSNLTLLSQRKLSS